MPVPDRRKAILLVETLEPYGQSSTSTTHHSSRDRGGGRGRRGAHRSATNNENDGDQGYINPSQQWKNIKQRKKKTSDFEVRVTEHKAINQWEGKGVSKEMSNSIIEELTEALATQKVINIECLKAMKNSELIETLRYIITFDKPDLPPAGISSQSTFFLSQLQCASA